MRVIKLDPQRCAEIVAGWTLVPNGECLLYLGSKNTNGYPYVYLNGHGGPRAGAHRVAAAASLGRDILPGLVVGHACHDESDCPGGVCLHRCCVNPSHLHEMTGSVNVRSGRTLAATNAEKVFCPAGHPLIEGNLVTWASLKGRRSCLTCTRQRDKEMRAALAKAAAAQGISGHEFKRRYGVAKAVLSV